MRRIHLFELEDQVWFPRTLRDLITHTLQLGVTTFQIYESVTPLLKKVTGHMGTRQIIDLCSGAAGPWLQLHDLLAQEEWPVHITLTDKYPNVEAFGRMRHLSDNQINYVVEPVDATGVPAHLTGVRTLFTSFHHFQFDSARAVLQDAVEQEAAICIFEFTERCMRTVMTTATLTPLAILALTPFIRPFTWARIFWTYVVPILPLAIAWDGIVSNLRTYSLEELQNLVDELDDEGYTWEIGQLTSADAKAPITYLLGYPTAAQRRRSKEGEGQAQVVEEIGEAVV